MVMNQMLNQTFIERLVARDYYVSGAPDFLPFVEPRSLTEPDKRLSHTSGSSDRHSARLRALSVSDPLSLFDHSLCSDRVSLPRSTTRGDLRSAGISRLIARPLQHSGPHHSRRGHLLPSFYIGQDTRVLPLRSIPQELLVRRSPGYLPALARLDAVLDPGVSASRSSSTRSPHGLRPNGGDRHSPKILGSRGYVSDSGLHPSPRHTRLTAPSASALGRYTTERLTNPYSGGPVRLRRFPSQQATIARLPHHSSTPFLLFDFQQFSYVLMNFRLVMLIGDRVGHDHVQLPSVDGEKPEDPEAALHELLVPVLNA